MTPDELEEIPEAIERLFYDQQARVMEDVVRRIHKTGRITSTADYQIGKMAQQGKSTEWIESEIKRLGNLTDAEVRSLYDKVVQADYVRKRGLYEQVNANYTPYEDNKVMQKWVHALIDQTQGELKNISRSMGFSVPTGNGKTAFTPLADYYQRYIDRACMDIMTGAFDYNTVLRRVAKEMADSGLEYVSYASGHVDRATVAARRAVMTGVNQLSGQINMRLADELRTNYFEVSWHSGARPEHWWGGQVFSKEDLVDVCGYGEVTGLLGANCRHSFMPFVPGVSTRTYTDEQLAEMNAKERETKTYNGKEYNAYSATQRQRELERRMQKQRANIVNLKKGEGSKEDIAAAQAKYLKTLYQYRDFSKQMGLSSQMQRVYVDRLGRVVNGRGTKKENIHQKTVENVAKSNIIVSGARITNPIGAEAEAFANMYYKEIRSFTTDVARIARNLGKNESEIKAIKAYLFEDESYLDPDEGVLKRFDPDCAIAQSWQRLMIGKDIKDHDRTLIEHELLEMKIKKENPGIEHWEAHELASKVFDYPREADEYYGNLKKHNEN